MIYHARSDLISSVTLLRCDFLLNKGWSPFYACFEPSCHEHIPNVFWPGSKFTLILRSYDWRGALDIKDVETCHKEPVPFNFNLTLMEVTDFIH